MIRDKLFDMAKDPKKVSITPEVKDDVPYLNFSSLENAMMQLKERVEDFQKAYNSGLQMPAADQNALNDILYKAERSLIDSNGLPRRPWYRHQVYAPGFYTGYGVKTLPGIREGIEHRNWKEAQENTEIVAKIITAYSRQVEQAINLLKKNDTRKSF
jgi:N-acetylated-alpha-linked acidic dipeptidase